MTFLVSAFPEKKARGRLNMPRAYFCVEESWRLATGVERNPNRASNDVSISLIFCI